MILLQFSHRRVATKLGLPLRRVELAFSESRF